METKRSLRYKPRIQSKINMIWKPRKEKLFWKNPCSDFVIRSGYLQFSFHRPQERRWVNSLRVLLWIMVSLLIKFREQLSAVKRKSRTTSFLSEVFTPSNQLGSRHFPLCTIIKVDSCIKIRNNRINSLASSPWPFFFCALKLRFGGKKSVSIKRTAKTIILHRCEVFLYSTLQRM